MDRLDERGKKCPLPVIALGVWARNASAGATVEVLSDDPASRHDIPAWCRMQGAELIHVDEEPPGVGVFQIRWPKAGA